MKERLYQWGLWPGLALFALGALGDLIFHSGAPPELVRALGIDGHRFHVITLVGMALIVAAVVGEQLLRRLAPAAAEPDSAKRKG